MSQSHHTAILMADLSGYSALTETHGAISAADLIDKYVEIVKDCLVGDSKLTERVGDEVMIISHSADHLLHTAAAIIANTSKEENFLRVHGGLHYGEVLLRNNSYFGSTINLASRIAKKASPGTFWCSGEFMYALTDASTHRFTPKGKHRFKNIAEEKEMAELSADLTHPFYVDPVCHMLILDTNLAYKHSGLKEIYFCSDACRNMYAATHADHIH
jgi:adenylate cyclase